MCADTEECRLDELAGFYTCTCSEHAAPAGGHRSAPLHGVSAACQARPLPGCLLANPAQIFLPTALQTSLQRT